MVKIKKKRNKHVAAEASSRPVRKADILYISVVWLFILMLWVVCIMNLIKGNYYGYKNYYDQPVGTFVLLIVLIVMTVFCLIMTIKTIKKRKVDMYSEPKWMNQPPWKWPWN